MQSTNVPSHAQCLAKVACKATNIGALGAAHINPHSRLLARAEAEKVELIDADRTRAAFYLYTLPGQLVQRLPLVLKGRVHGRYLFNVAFKLLKRRSHLPIVIDPSHGTGHAYLVPDMARAAIAAGCKLAINTDAHGQGDLHQLPYGVLTARRAGATKQDVVNALTAGALKKWLASTRP